MDFGQHFSRIKVVEVSERLIHVLRYASLLHRRVELALGHKLRSGTLYGQKIQTLRRCIYAVRCQVKS